MNIKNKRRVITTDPKKSNLKQDNIINNFIPENETVGECTNYLKYSKFRKWLKNKKSECV